MSETADTGSATQDGGAVAVRVMIVDDAPENLLLLADLLEQQGCEVSTHTSGAGALKAAKLNPPDLILLDITMPEMDGYQVCQALKAHPRLHNIPVIFLSALDQLDDKVKAFDAGGVDYITKPFQFEDVQARISIHLRLHRLQQQLEQQNRELRSQVTHQVAQLSQAQYAMIFALSKLVEARDGGSGPHVERLQRYARLLAECLRLGSPYFHQIDSQFVELIGHAAPLHDIGTIGIPDQILNKPGKLDADERTLMQTHVAIGEQTLREIAARHPENAFITMAIDIAGAHHERWDGSGYPRGLAGESIPLAARIMALVDVYDALRSERCYKPALDHAATCAQIRAESGRQFDPVVVAAFLDLESQFAELYARSSGQP